jgi:hypothetical protein
VTWLLAGDAPPTLLDGPTHSRCDHGSASSQSPAYSMVGITKLVKIGEAADGLALLRGPGQRRLQQRGQEGYDGNSDEQFDQRERAETVGARLGVDVGEDHAFPGDSIDVGLHDAQLESNQAPARVAPQMRSSPNKAP